jgi:hypothetical protein
MTAHTPGPWGLYPTSKRFAKDTPVEVRDEACGYLLAELVTQNLMGNAEANGRLMAAAPDLLAACNEWLALQFDNDCDLGGDYHATMMGRFAATDCPLCRLRAAIAKATGKAVGQ